MNDLDENQAIGALAYGITVLPASIAASGFFPLGVPGFVWLAIAAVGGALGGGFFWERHRVLGALAFGLAGALSPFVTAVYVQESVREVSPFVSQEVEFSVLGLFAGPLVLLLGASVFVAVTGFVVDRVRASRSPAP
ncbi:MAG: hypothetical protein R3F61_05675 [Myxococcota bacterium]